MMWCLVLLVLSVLAPCQPLLLSENEATSKGNPWPLPQDMVTSDTLVHLYPHSFSFKVVNNTCDILQKALLRYEPPMLYAATRPRSTHYRHVQIHSESQPLPILKSLSVDLESPCETWPYYGMDESYVLNVAGEEPDQATLSSSSIWGILRGLETFSQLFWKDESGQLVAYQMVIDDFPRFSHRGLLLDTSRHYLPLPVIKDNLDLMAMNKMNTFHWHIVDDQSFPYQSVLFPNLSKYGAYASDMVYTLDDVQDILDYARIRGIRVMVEFDTPGHTRSWGVGQGDLLTQCYDASGKPKPGDFGPVDPSKDTSYAFMKKFFYEVLSVFPEPFLHLGGDEVDMRCWESNPDIRNFMKSLNITQGKDLQEYYIDRLIDIIKELNDNKVVLWQEMFDDSKELDKNIIIHVWKDGDKFQREMKRVTDSNMFAILSSCWYLNYIEYGNDWHKQYQCEPTDGLDDDKKALVLGGEAAMWGEYVDETNIIARLWPRASAVAERLWSSETNKSPGEADPRMKEHRCRLLGRGYGVQPANGPGFCP